MSSKIFFFIIKFSLLYLSNQNLVILSIFCVGKLTYRSFMSKMVILCWLLIRMLFRSCATSFEFLMAYVYCSFINWLSFFIKVCGKPIWWCLCVIYYWSYGFISFTYFDQGIKYCCHGFYLFVLSIFVGLGLLRCYLFITNCICGHYTDFVRILTIMNLSHFISHWTILMF